MSFNQFNNLAIYVTSELCHVSDSGIQNVEPNYQTYALSRPTVPGYVTMFLCNKILNFDNIESIRNVGILLDGEISSDNRFVITSNSLDAWQNVPLANWIESRVQKRTFIFSLSESINKLTFGNETPSPASIETLFCKVVADLVCIANQKYL